MQYLTICFLGIPFITAYNVLSSIFRGMGSSKSPMYFIACACVCNIALDYLFMGALRLAPRAPRSERRSQAISVLLALLTIRKRGLGLPMHRSDLRPDKAVSGDILKIGLPITCQDGLIQVAFIVITVIANQRGLTDAAAVGIVEKVISFLFLVPSSMLSTVSALGAQNIGAGKPERARKTLLYAILLAAGFGVIVAAIVQFVAEPIVGLFTPDEAAIVAGGQYLRGYIFDCIFAGLHFSFSGYFCACGKSGLSFLHNITAIVLVRVPGVWLMSRLYPQTLLPMGLATAAGSALSVVICMIAYTVLRKKKRARRWEASMDKEQLFSIGEVARLFHMSVSSLRHYESLGLLSPEYINPDSGYRYYSTRQFEVLNTLRYLRALDMLLPEIADFCRTGMWKPSSRSSGSKKLSSNKSSRSCRASSGKLTTAFRSCKTQKRASGRDCAHPDARLPHCVDGRRAVFKKLS